MAVVQGDWQFPPVGQRSSRDGEQAARSCPENHLLLSVDTSSSVTRGLSARWVPSHVCVVSTRAAALSHCSLDNNC